MIKVLIIEDEIPARNKIKRLLAELDSYTNVVAEIDNVNDAIDFFNKNTVDIVFSDIELLDGNAFDIYAKVSISCPVIFTTAYNQYWMDAFESNGIAYLLKPFNKEKFLHAWNKFLLLQHNKPQESDLMAKLQSLILNNTASAKYKKQFTIQAAKSIAFINTDDIVFFEANNGVVFVYDLNGKKHLISEATLKDIEEKIDPNDFFKINRSEIVHRKFIEKIERFTKNILSVKLKNQQNYLSTSQSTTALFNSWLKK